MSLIHATSPHIIKPNSVHALMIKVILATIPAFMLHFSLFGWGIVFNLISAIAFSVTFEALCLKWRGRSVGFYLTDYSAVLTAVLIALAFPSAAPWWLIMIGSATAIVLGKHLYGGLGFNPW